MGETYIRLASIFPLFVPAIRDYIDVLNNAYDSISSDINLQQIIYQSFLFFISSIKFTIIYFLSFQWVQDLSYLPILVPQLKIEILKEHFFLQTPESNFFTFLEIPSYTNNKFLLGIFASPFSSLFWEKYTPIGCNWLCNPYPNEILFFAFNSYLTEALGSIELELFKNS